MTLALLIDLLGHDAVAERLGIASEDLLTTRAFFALKADEARRADWRAASPADKPAIAASAAETLPALEAVTGPHAQGVEWYLPLDRLCALGAPLDPHELYAPSLVGPKSPLGPHGPPGPRAPLGPGSSPEALPWGALSQNPCEPLLGIPGKYIKIWMDGNQRKLPNHPPFF